MYMFVYTLHSTLVLTRNQKTSFLILHIQFIVIFIEWHFVNEKIYIEIFKDYWTFFLRKYISDDNKYISYPG